MCVCVCYGRQWSRSFSLEVYFRDRVTIGEAVVVVVVVAAALGSLALLRDQIAQSDPIFS